MDSGSTTQTSLINGVRANRFDDTDEPDKRGSCKQVRQAPRTDEPDKRGSCIQVRQAPRRDEPHRPGSSRASAAYGQMWQGGTKHAKLRRRRCGGKG